MLSPFETSMFFPLFVLLAALAMWFAFGRPGFLRDFAKLLDQPEFVDSFGNRLVQCWFLKGEFRGRKVVILLQRSKTVKMVVVSMETRAAITMEPADFTGYRADREGELALFALEVKHDLRLQHADGCLKVMWQPSNVFSRFAFPPPLDAPKWRSVLEAMSTLSGSLERWTANHSRRGA